MKHDDNQFSVNFQDLPSFSEKEFDNLAKHKLLSIDLDLATRYAPTNLAKSMRCDKCGNYLKFDAYENVNKPAEFRRKLTDARFCQTRFCPTCSFLRARSLANEMRSVCTQIEAQQKVSYIFLTLTIKNPPLTELRSTLQTMSKAFDRLSKTKAFQNAIKGYIRSIEFIGDSTTPGFAHPHIHALLVVSPYYFTNSKYYISQAKWAQLWQQSLRVDYTPVVDIRAIKSKNSDWLDSDSAIVETIKYCAKPLCVKMMSQEDFQLFDSETKGIRQYNKGGLFKDVKPLPNDEISKDVWRFIGNYLVTFNGQDYKLY